MEADTLARLAALESSNRQLRMLVSLAILLFTALAAVAFYSSRTARSSFLQTSDSLRVRQIVVVDSQGTVRARLGAHLQDAVIDGRRLHRGEDIAGLLLYDDGGRERGGYVTFSPSRNVALTLDTRDRQVALFAADPEDGVTARVWGGSNWVEMRASTVGAHLNVGRENELVIQQPPLTEAEVAKFCTELEDEVRHLTPPPPPERVLAACKRRMPDSACRECPGIR